MNYTQHSLIFKVKKAARYVQLYGAGRTLAKVRGQYHARREYASLPAQREKRAGRHVGIIGCGGFAYSNIAYYLKKNYGSVIRGVMDVDINKAASLFDDYDADFYTNEAQELVTDPDVDLLFIASNHASHAEYAISALRANKCVHIEKPHVVSSEQLLRLCNAMRASGGRVTLGFNRTHSPFGREIRRLVAEEQGPAMFNWFIAGHEIPPDHWYFSPEEGGRVLGNLCHWTDFVLQLVPSHLRYPIIIKPTRAQKSDCDISVSYVFAEGTIATLTFSAKGHTFEGVRERFAAHRGNLLLAMDDFQELRIDLREKRETRRLSFRDHGHQEAIRMSYSMVRGAKGLSSGESVENVWQTGDLFLKTKEALDRDSVVTIQSGSVPLQDLGARA